MNAPSPQSEWWKGAVFYQIYPRSFMDSSGDGIGDLKGATQRLDHIADLGIDAIWLSPFYKSPMKDFGYDISDYRDVDPLFGTLDDFDAFLKRAHELNLKVIIDLVLAHTSKEHPWFIESRSNADNPKADWYVWANAKEDGTAPNNWMSVFGGPAWTFETRRGQYYMHNFLTDQPQLNYHNPDVQKAILDICQFWLERGVDGFRLDVINFTFHDEELRDNPAKDPYKDGWATQFTKPDPYSMQRHIYDKSRPEALEFASKIRKLTDQYSAIMTLAEIGDDDFVSCAADYTKGDDRFNTAYNFSLMTGDTADAIQIKDAVELYNSKDGGWPSWSLCNHDVIRVVSRWGEKLNYDKDAEKSAAFAKVLTAALTSLRGTIFMYQGEELGLNEAQIPFDQLQDPWGKYLWPEWQGRDGCRTPMPWDNTKPHGGFSSADKTWLPLAPQHLDKNVATQKDDPQSVLTFTQKFLRWRKKHAVLVTGDIEFLPQIDKQCLIYRRTLNGKSALCCFNLGDAEQKITIATPKTTDEMTHEKTEVGKNHIKLPPFGYAVLID